MIDILDELLTDKLTLEDAENLLEDTVDKYHDDVLGVTPEDFLKLDKYEWTAVGFGINLCVLARWRKDGWPEVCKNCGNKRDYKQFGWKIQNNTLVCVKC